MKKSKFIAALVLASTFTLMGCDEECSHVDEDKNHVCDKCGETVSEHAFDQKVKNENTLKSAATCEGDAVYFYSCSCGEISETETFVEEGTALGHDYGDIQVTWAGDTATATRTCLHNSEHKITETKKGTFVQDTAATCTTNKKGHYTVQFDDARFGSAQTAINTTEIANSSLNHNYGNLQVVWDGKNATATMTCSRDSSHVITETKEGTFVQDTAAKCGANQKGHYAVTFADTRFGSAQTGANSVEIPNTALDHNFGNLQVTWNGDTATATMTCTRGCGKTISESKKGAYVEDTASTQCSENGTGHFEVTFEHSRFGSARTEADTYEKPYSNLPHTDLNSDHICDVCGGDAPWVESIELDYLTSYIGAYESVTFTANVTAHNGCSTDVTWEMVTSGSAWTNYPTEVSNIFSLVDNEDGTATLFGVGRTGYTDYAVKVKAISKFDTSVESAQETITCGNYNSTKQGTLNTFFGANKWKTIPFFSSTTFTISGNTLTGKSTARSIKQMKNSFDNQGLWTKISSSDSGATYTYIDGNNSYTLVISENPSSSGKGMFVIVKDFAVPDALIGTWSFDGYDDYGSCDFSLVLDITKTDATLTAYSSDGPWTFENFKCISITDNVYEFENDDYYSFSLKVGDGDITVTTISGSYFDYYWVVDTPATLETPTLFSVGIDETIEHGSVTVNIPTNGTKSISGVKVEFAVTADSGYEVDEISVSGAEVSLTELYGGKYSFIMPEADIVIHATFTEKEIVAFDWATFEGQFRIQVSQLYYGVTYDYTYVITYNQGTATAIEYNNPFASSATVTVDSEGCGAGQIHLTFSDTRNYVDVDVIVETTDGGQTFIVAVDNTI